MTFSFKIYVVLNIWNLVYPLFQSFFEDATTQSYSFYQELSNTMLQVFIKVHLTLVLYVLWSRIKLLV